MSERVPTDRIEEIVGVERHATEHYGRAVSTEQTVYILHSQECKDTTPDLRKCPFSIALDRGIQQLYPWTEWRRTQDLSTRLTISRGFLMPDLGVWTQEEVDRINAEARAMAERLEPFIDGPKPEAGETS